MTTWIMTDDLPGKAGMRQWAKDMGLCLLKSGSSVDTEAMEDREFNRYLSEHCHIEVMSTKDVMSVGGEMMRRVSHNGGATP